MAKIKLNGFCAIAFAGVLILSPVALAANHAPAAGGKGAATNVGQEPRTKGAKVETQGPSALVSQKEVRPAADAETDSSAGAPSSSLRFPTMSEERKLTFFGMNP